MASPITLAQEDPSTKRRRMMAESMMSQALQGGPTGHWMEGVGRLANAYVGAKMASTLPQSQNSMKNAMAGGLFNLGGLFGAP